MVGSLQPKTTISVAVTEDFKLNQALAKGYHCHIPLRIKRMYTTLSVFAVFFQVKDVINMDVGEASEGTTLEKTLLHWCRENTEG
jgi:hypothetical protein